jgi:GH15 family glucan-1,4-alpha-glucosidase
MSMVDLEPAAGNAFPPIAEYAFLSDCEVAALIAPSGNVEWLCLPRADSPSVFAAILDEVAEASLGAARSSPDA